ncbi:Emc10p [Lachancea thermotolerans CBS 6340]|uniref:KLTH0E14212p n=1 Tax=Lachancea thermotolerans (strain ATCC 56472 / CBS 6340 / NRRL Y-8284) TaxID=559295 RepID=C5DIP9_LACTC|nr:KLTH0E14212p [Lachancea thermotolerans CBS 6340]CAR23660.1 KLTH0E14212p [Lachancea thermotolerans CBS 6340]
MRFLCVFLLCVTAVLGSEVRIPLFMQKPGQSEKVPLATLIYDPELSFVDIADINDSFKEDSYCVGAQMAENYYSCFSYLNLRHPLRYDLYLDTSQNTHLLYKLSLKPNPNAKGIQPLLRAPVAGPEAQVTKLRKTTKTYEDKKAMSNPSAASLGEDIEIDDRSFIQKNWKFILIGLVLYAISSAGNSSQ